MIRKEQFIRKDGVQLYRTYSDTDHLIKKVASGAIYSSAIDVSEDEQYEEIEDYIPMEGPDSYDEVVVANESMEAEAQKIARKINSLHLSNNEALSVMNLYPTWMSKVGCTIEAGDITQYDGKLWKARQTHTALDIYPPSIYTAALYEVVEKEHEGTIDDPIPYTPPMEIYEGKYYTQDDVLYECIRSSGTALSHDLSALVGIYVIIK